MANITGTISTGERSLRSVFVGNVSQETSEEQLKDVLSEVGPVVSFSLVYDHENGKSKGFGFCEFKDQETALSAMRNLNSFELNGRPLMIDSATSEKAKEELKTLQASMAGTSVDGSSGESERAPEAISKAVASLPPEQMFELMKQMKVCIQNNPNEARNMLLQNPQLAYALLQAQVIMRIVEPQVALGLLHRQTPNPSQTPQREEPVEKAPSQTPSISDIFDPSQMFRGTLTPMPVPAPNIIQPTAPIRFSLLGDRPVIGTENRAPTAPVAQTPQAPPSVHIPPFQERGLNPYGREGFDPVVLEPMGDRDMRSLIADRDMRQPPIASAMGDRDMRQLPMGDQDLRHMPQNVQLGPQQPPVDPRFRGMAGQMGPFGNVVRPNFADPRAVAFDRGGASARPDEPRPNMGGVMAPRPPVPQAPRPPGPPRGQQQQQQQQPPAAAAANMAGISPQDQEKAALIMQVLQLSDQQIAMLPAEQRQSILILKEQVARSAH